LHPKFKTLGSALAAALAMSAVVASTASAANFTATKYPTSITSESAKGNGTFKTEAGTVECKTHYAGTLSEPSETLDATFAFIECLAFGLNATVTVPSTCKFRLSVSGAASFVAVGGTCTGIVIHSGTCTTVIKPQGPLSEVDLANNAATTDITAQATLTGIAYEVTQDGFLCPYNGIGAKAGATYTQHSPATLQSTSGTAIHIG
jgi:hypothetical protein